MFNIQFTKCEINDIKELMEEWILPENMPMIYD